MRTPQIMFSFGPCLAYLCVFYFCFFTAPPPSMLYTLSLHDALPISSTSSRRTTSRRRSSTRATGPPSASSPKAPRRSPTSTRNRSEEHTSELQSHLNLVCRLLLEKKKKKQQKHVRNTTNNNKEPSNK